MKTEVQSMINSMNIC